MAIIRLGILKSVSLLFLLPGLAGLIISAMVSTHYLNAFPRQPDIEQNRVIPRGIHGVVVYQTPKEDRDLTRMEYTSVAIFGVGLVLGLVYLEKWGSAQAQAAEEGDRLAPHAG